MEASNESLAFKTRKLNFIRLLTFRALVVDQLVEQSLPTPEIHGSNPIIGKILASILSTNCIIEETQIKKKWPGMAHLT